MGPISGFEKTGGNTDIPIKRFKEFAESGYWEVQPKDLLAVKKKEWSRKMWAHLVEKCEKVTGHGPNLPKRYWHKFGEFEKEKNELEEFEELFEI